MHIKSRIIFCKAILAKNSRQNPTVKKLTLQAQNVMPFDTIFCSTNWFVMIFVFFSHTSVLVKVLSSTELNKIQQAALRSVLSRWSQPTFTELSTQQRCSELKNSRLWCWLGAVKSEFVSRVRRCWYRIQHGSQIMILVFSQLSNYYCTYTSLL